MKVYVVIYHSAYDPIIDKIFFDCEKAEIYCEEQCRTTGFYHEVQEHEVN